MQVSLLQFECIACALLDLPPTAPSSLEKFPSLFSPHASLQLRPSRQSSPSSSSFPCSASSSSSGCGRPWESCGSPSSQVWWWVMVVPPLASPQAEPASPSSVLIIKWKVEIKLHRCHRQLTHYPPPLRRRDVMQPLGSQITVLSEDTEPSRAPVAELMVWQLGRVADQRPDLPGAAARRSAGTASCAPETRGAFPSSLHASQRDSAVLKRPISPLPLPFLLLLLRLFSPHRGNWQLHSSDGVRKTVLQTGQPVLKPPWRGRVFTLLRGSWARILPESAASSLMSLALSGSRKDHFPGEMTNQSHYYPINMMEEITSQTRARTTCAQPAVRQRRAASYSQQQQPGPPARPPQRILYVVRCGDPQHPPRVKGVTCWVTNAIIIKGGGLKPLWILKSHLSL